MDNGDGTPAGGNFRGGGKATGPLHVHRVSLADASDAVAFAPFGMPGGVIVNPPLVDAARRIVVAFDSGNAQIGAFRYDDTATTFAPLWRNEMGASNHFLLYADDGGIVVNDHDGKSEHVVTLDIETGEEVARVAAPSPIQSFVFQAPGWADDVYTCAFPSITRTFVV
jgi:hypothetical protein